MKNSMQIMRNEYCSAMITCALNVGPTRTKEPTYIRTNMITKDCSRYQIHNENDEKYTFKMIYSSFVNTILRDNFSP